MKPSTHCIGRVIRVHLISSSEITRTSLRLLLESRPTIRVVEAASCRAALDAANIRPHVRLFDHEPGAPGDAELLPQVMEAWNDVPLLILTGTRDPEVHCVFMQLPLMGLVLKTDPVESLFRAIERVSAGESWFDRSLMEEILGSLARRQKQGNAPPLAMPMETLTTREKEVTRLVGEALSNRQIAQRLFISETTVRHHLSSVFGKLGVSSRLELVKYAYSSGLACPYAIQAVALPPQKGPQS